MSLDTSVNWPLFLFTSLIILLRSFAGPACLWLLNRIYSPSATIDSLVADLKRVNTELGALSQVDEFAAYARKERQRNTLVQRLKDERTGIENKQKNLLTYVRLSLNAVTVLVVILLAITGHRHQTMPLFDFPFFRFPLVLWMMALNTCVTSLADMYMRYRTSKTRTD